MENSCSYYYYRVLVEGHLVDGGEMLGQGTLHQVLGDLRDVRRVPEQLRDILHVGGVHGRPGHLAKHLQQHVPGDIVSLRPLLRDKSVELLITLLPLLQETLHSKFNVRHQMVIGNLHALGKYERKLSATHCKNVERVDVEYVI